MRVAWGVSTGGSPGCPAGEPAAGGPAARCPCWRPARKDAGFTLTELLVAMVVMGLFGTALARLLVDNSRFVARQDAMLQARATARAALQAMLAELHLVADSGLRAATRDSVTVRVPYAFGVACRTSAGTLVVSLMPADSLAYAQAVPDGLAWRTSGGAYSRAITRITLTAWSDPALCWADSIRVVPGGRLAGVRGIPGGWLPPPGSLFYLFQTVTYRFMNSADLPGRRALWRRAGNGPYEELAAPFDTAAKFAFLMGPYLAVQVRTSLTTQASRDSVRGLELRLTGASLDAPPGRRGPQLFDLRARVGFRNKLY